VKPDAYHDLAGQVAGATFLPSFLTVVLLLRPLGRGAAWRRLSSRPCHVGSCGSAVGLLWSGGGLGLVLRQADAIGLAMLLQDLDAVLKCLDLAVVKCQYINALGGDK
jgi:hypothetical protein